MTVFLPCRAGSERVPNKNTKTFAEVEGGLLYLKLSELLKVQNIDKILLSTNDKDVIDIAKTFNNSKIEIDLRPKELASSSTSTDEVINYVPLVIKDEHILWTHVTSPFISSAIYSKAITLYFEGLENNFDSLMTVTKLQTFLWDQNGSINYDRAVEKWPRTQTLPKLYEINSGIFINSRQNYLSLNDRIGKKPFMFETEGTISFDIDWPEDFKMAEFIYKSQKNKLE